MIIHFHYSSNPNSGEIRRIRNIDNEICNIAKNKCIEVEFYSLRDRKLVKKTWRFNLTDNVVRKYYVPLLPFTGNSSFIQWICDLWTSIAILFIYLRHRPEMIVGEYSTSYSAMKMKNLLNCKYIADMHGALPEEYTYNNPNIVQWRLNYITRLETLTSKKADYIICQSEEMKRHIAKKYSVNKERVFVYKCGVNTKMFKLEEDKKSVIRKQLGISDNSFVFVYVGGLMKWQKIEESLMIFADTHKIVDDCKFLILTREVDTLKLLLKQLNLEYLSNDVIALSSPFDKVSDYLNAADVAFLLRDNVVMNQVASPTKLAEYMACGLPVISSKVAACWVEQSMIEDNTIICFEEGCNLKRLIDNVKNCNREQIRQHAINSFSLEIDSENIVRMYSCLK
nr:glycosyltransferase [uncultured Bacteroides sp.]